MTALFEKNEQEIAKQLKRFQGRKNAHEKKDIGILLRARKGGSPVLFPRAQDDIRGIVILTCPYPVWAGLD